jgi:hypothetical protein
VTYFQVGAASSSRLAQAMSETGAYQVIGASTVGGYSPTVYTHGSDGRPLTTPAGESMTVVVLTNQVGRAVNALAFVERLGQIPIARTPQAAQVLRPGCSPVARPPAVPAPKVGGDELRVRALLKQLVGVR